MTLAASAGVVGALAVTAGLLILALRLLKRLQGSFGSRASRVPIQVLQRHALGPKHGVALVRVGGRVLVLGLGDHGCRLLTELDGADRDIAIDQADRPAPIRRREPSDVQRFLSRLTLTIAVAASLPAGAADAQTARDSARVVPISPASSPAPAGSATGRAARAPAPAVALPKAPNVQVTIGGGDEQLKLTGSVGLVVFLGALTLLPAAVLLMTSFTRILIVLHFLRSALGTQGSPPGQLLVAIAVLLTGVVMTPVLEEANRTALQPYFAGQIDQSEAYQRALDPLRRFMLANVREKDLATFTELSGAENAASVEEIPTLTVVSAFVTSELQAAFWMGFVIFLPFVVVDLIVATSLMSLGMFMVPPVMISLPFKLLLFVLADGWSMVGQNLVASFNR